MFLAPLRVRVITRADASPASQRQQPPRTEISRGDSATLSSFGATWKRMRFPFTFLEKSCATQVWSAVKKPPHY